jgi:hypothetical protein
VIETIKRMQTTVQLRIRFEAAFKRYAADDAHMRVLAATADNQGDSAAIRVISAHSRLLSNSEQAYRRVRLEYARRLLRKSRKTNELRLQVF